MQLFGRYLLPEDSANVPAQDHWIAESVAARPGLSEAVPPDTNVLTAAPFMVPVMTPLVDAEATLEYLPVAAVVTGFDATQVPIWLQASATTVLAPSISVNTQEKRENRCNDVAHVR